MSWDYLDKINWIPFNKDQKRLTEFLYSILALCFMIWSIVFVQVNNNGIIDTSSSKLIYIPTEKEIKEEQLRLSANNPVVELSAEEIKIKEEQLKKSEKNPIVKLTKEQIELKKAQLAQ